MSDIELVIKIPKEDYLTFSELSEKEKVNNLSYYERMIANGIPLPKGHGDLIDRTELLKNYGLEDAVEYDNKTPNQMSHSYSMIHLYEIADTIRDAQAVIEADEVEE